MHETSCGAVVFRNKGSKRLYLMLHYEEGHWEFIKGHVEKGESEQKTALREAEEETGLADLNLIEGFREKINYWYTHDGKRMSKDVIFFLAETKTKKIILSDEHIGFKWLEFDDALKQLTFDNAKNTLKKAEEFLNDS